MQIIMSEMKNTLVRLNTRMDIAKNRQMNLKTLQQKLNNENTGGKKSKYKASVIYETISSDLMYI